MAGGGINPKDVEGAVDAARRIAGAIGTSKAEIHINSGGFAVWIAATCCIAMLVAVSMHALAVDREFDRINGDIRELRARDNAQQAYLNALMRGERPKPPEK